MLCSLEPNISFEENIANLYFNIIAVNKPQNDSSAQVVRNVQRELDQSSLFNPVLRLQLMRLNERQRRRKHNQQIKLGHGGTLDPMATGVLVLGIGQGTKSLSEFIGCTKTYETVVIFGAATNTYDCNGKIVSRAPYEHITRDLVEKVLKENFSGKIHQVPPIFSAKRMDGIRLYQYAKDGVPLPRAIAGKDHDVQEMKILEWFEPGKHQYSLPTREAGSSSESEDNVDGDGAISEQVAGTADWKKAWKKARKKERVSNRKRRREVEEGEKKIDNVGAEAGIAATVPSVAETAADPSSPPLTKKVKCGDEVEYEDQEIATETLKSSEPPQLSSQTEPSHSSIKATESSSTTTINPSVPPLSDSIQTITHPESQSDTVPQSQSPPQPQPPAVKLRMSVSSGFYVRSLCHDLGIALGSHGLMCELVRTRQGQFELGKNVLEYDDFAKGKDVWEPAVEHLLRQWDEQRISKSVAAGEQFHPTKRRDGNFANKPREDSTYSYNEGDVERARRNTSSPEG